MDSTFTKKLVGLRDPDLVLRALIDHREEILDAISEKRLEPTPALMIELAALNVQIGDAQEVSHDS